MSNILKENYGKLFGTDKFALFDYISFLARNTKETDVNFDDFFFTGLESILKAEKTFKPEYNVPFVYYARKIIKNDLASLVVKSKRNKVETHSTFEEPILRYDPTSEYDANILFTNVFTTFNAFEKKVIYLLLGGYTIGEIAEKTQSKYKKVDNAMQSIKRKIRK